MTRASPLIDSSHGTRPSGGTDACADLVDLARREAVPGIRPRAYIRRLGHAGAGVRPGLIGLYDLARAGDNRLPGRGFRPPLDDGTRGQARHLLGIAACVERFGARPTWWVSVHVRRDPPESPDGRLTDIGIAFAERLLSGELAIADAAGWLKESLCADSASEGHADPAHERDADHARVRDADPASERPGRAVSERHADNANGVARHMARRD